MINQELLTALMEVKELPSEYFETVIVGETVYFIKEIKNCLEYDSMPKADYDDLLKHIKFIEPDIEFENEGYPNLEEFIFKYKGETWYLIKENGIIFIQPATSKNELSFKM